MKSRVLTALILSTTFFSSTLSLSVSTVQAESAPSIDQGRILHTEGTVEVKAPGEDIWKTPQKGAWVQKGSEIRTGDGSSCEIGLGGTSSRSVVRMKPNSQTALEKLDADKIRVDLASGRVLVWVRDLPKGSTFEVATPTAVATARGTGWEQGMDNILVFEHAVEVAAPNGESMLVEEGNGLEFKDEGLGQLFELPADAKAEWGDFQAQADQHLAEEPKSTQEQPRGTDAPPAAKDEDRPAITPPNDPNHPDFHGTTDGPSGPDMPGGNEPEMGPDTSMMDHPGSAAGPNDMMQPDAMQMPDTMTDTTANPPDNMFENFDQTFENPMEYERPTGGMNETMNEARDQYVQSAFPPTGTSTNQPHVCYDTSGNPYPC